MKQGAASKKNQTVQTTAKARVISGSDLPLLLDSLQNAIERRAYEIFENRGRADGGHDEDWARAADEILQPLPGNTTENSDSITLRCFVQAAHDVAVAVEPRRVIVWVDSDSALSASGGQDSRPVQVAKALQFELPKPVDSSRPTVGLNGQILTITVPKAATGLPQPAA